MPAQQPPNIRPDARELVAFFDSVGVGLDQFTPGPDGWHSEASIRACLTATARQARLRTPRSIPTAATRMAAMASTSSAVASSQTAPRTAGPYATTAGLPAFTASGVDPKALAAYPPAIRAVMAAVPTQEQAYEIGQRYGGMTDDEAMKALALDPTIPAEVAFAGWPAGYVEPPKFTSATTTATAAETQQQDLQAHHARARRIDPENARFWDAMNARTAATRTTRPNPKPSDDYWF